MRLLVSPRASDTVGLIAFGVGIAEMLEVAEMLLEAGSTVRLLYASRNTQQIIYRDVLHALLLKYPSRFR